MGPLGPSFASEEGTDMFYEHPWMFQREKVSPVGNDDRPTLRQRLTKRLKTRRQR